MIQASYWIEGRSVLQMVELRRSREEETRDESERTASSGISADACVAAISFGRDHACGGQYRKLLRYSAHHGRAPAGVPTECARAGYDSGTERLPSHGQDLP